MVRHNEAPQIDVFLVPSTETPGGIGEPSTAVIAGAIANAVFAATGKRVYRLPISGGAAPLDGLNARNQESRIRTAVSVLIP